MIRRVFEAMDGDKDGLLSMGDVRSYFRAIGRNANDLAVRKWISMRDIDQDGAVSLSEFVASYAQQLDPASKYVDADGRAVESSKEPSAVAAAFGALRIGATPHETVAAADAAIEYVQRVLDSPSVKPFWSIHLSEEAFKKSIGRLFGGVKLMCALGFSLESNGTVLALRDPQGKQWEVVPQPVRVSLQQRMEELQSHRNSLLEPSVSNVAAGIELKCSIITPKRYIYFFNFTHADIYPFCFFGCAVGVRQFHLPLANWANLQNGRLIGWGPWRPSTRSCATYSSFPPNPSTSVSTCSTQTSTKSKQPQTLFPSHPSSCCCTLLHISSSPSLKNNQS